ncbi:histidine kinase [Paenibacillus sp. J5C_2022]|nr:histidine kinase [Paenibacillus sp. J5C2022]
MEGGLLLMLSSFSRLIVKIWVKFTSKLFYKMVLIYSILTLLPLMLVIGLFYNRSNHILESNITAAKKQSLVEMMDKIDSNLRNVEQIAMSIQKDPLILKTLMDDYVQFDQRQLDAETSLRIKERMASLIEANTLIDAVYLENRSHNVYYVDSEFKFESNLALGALAHKKPGFFLWASFPDHQRIVGAIEIIDPYLDRRLGILAVMLKPERVAQMYSTYDSQNFYLMNANKLILSTSDPDRISTRFHYPSDKSMIVLERNSDYSGLKYVSLFSSQVFNRELDNLVQFALLITAITWVIVLVLTVFILRHVTKPLMKLNRLMIKAKKEVYETFEDIRTNDEVGRLCASFNDLIIEIRDLIQTVYKVELLNKEAELKTLRAQINPHFLYNTLESINVFAKHAGATAVSEMIHLLAAIFRFSISPGNDFVYLHKEIELITYYLQLFKYRYGDKFQWSIDVSEELLLVSVPRFILQPIVENAIIHGIDQLPGPGTISVRAYELDYDLILEVEDNGPGIQAGNHNGFGIGMSHVARRLQLIYGERYGLTTEPALPNGTIMRLRLPIAFSKEDDTHENHRS